VRIIFIRHGQTDSNVGHLLDTGYPGAPLNELGLAQAAALPQKLVDEPIEIVLTSDITRARQTGEPLAEAKGVPLVTHPGVREIFAGDWEMATEWEPYTSMIVSWAVDPTQSMPNGDSGISFITRFDEAISELLDYDCAAVVSHGGALWAWLSARTDLRTEPKRGLHPGLKNTDVVIVEGVPTSWKILSWAGQEVSR